MMTGEDAGGGRGRTVRWFKTLKCWACRLGPMAATGPPKTRRALVLRAILVAIALSAIIFPRQFAEHFAGHLSGSIVHGMITREWGVVALNVAVFVSFLVPLSFRRRVDWREYGLVVAFFVSLFVEMYGVPLILLLVAPHLEGIAPEHVGTVTSVEFLGVRFGFTVPMVYGTLLVIFGTVLVLLGWLALYRGLKRGPLVTTGVYSYTRNPQYLGFILVIAGWLVGWPTVLVVVMAPILIVMYARLCVREERELASLPGYEEYRSSVPLLV